MIDADLLSASDIAALYTADVIDRHEARRLLGQEENTTVVLLSKRVLDLEDEKTRLEGEIEAKVVALHAEFERGRVSGYNEGYTVGRRRHYVGPYRQAPYNPFVVSTWTQPQTVTINTDGASSGGPL